MNYRLSYVHDPATGTVEYDLFEADKNGQETRILHEVLIGEAAERFLLTFDQIKVGKHG